MDLDHFLSLPDTESKTIKSLFISSFPERPSRQTVKAEIMAVKLKNFLLKLQPDQLDTFVLNGWGIDNYLQYFPGEPFLRQQTGIRKVCLPLASLFWSQGASERVLTPGIFPNLESLYVSDMCYLSHIRDVWTIIEDKGETLKSLAILCPLGSQLKSFLGYPDMFSNPYTFLQIEVALKVLRDLYVYGFPNLGRFLNDCARNLIDYKILRSLRLEQCPRIESLLQTICNIEEMPSLKSLQLIETCSPETFETIIPRLSPLDTLYIIFPREQNLPKYDMIKYYHSKTLRRIILPENLRVLRIVGTPRFANGALYEPARDALAIAKKHVYHTSIKNKQPRLAVIAFFTLIPPPIYVTAQHPIIYLVDYVREEDKLIPILRLTDIGAVRWLFPDTKIMEFERRDKPWADE
ncbi:hypothetical protein TWF703_008255 [Orbilia oligospora]|uniref:Uncharacterized protein n=1 Tax=Orbilia oligospora TaxID=2813651 RepID=A0A7C8JKZ9_ORBOL|nr:hypothetical protein TWF703_008255 [Orbilia oligospora]